MSSCSAPSWMQTSVMSRDDASPIPPRRETLESVAHGRSQPTSHTERPHDRRVRTTSGYSLIPARRVASGTLEHRYYSSQNATMASCRAFTLENPSAEAAASSSSPKSSESPETVLPRQFARPGVPEMAAPVRENVMLKVGAGAPPMMSVPIRNQSGFKSELRIQACRSPMNGVPGATIGFGADKYRKSPPATWTSGRKKY